MNENSQWIRKLPVQALLSCAGNYSWEILQVKTFHIAKLLTWYSLSRINEGLQMKND